MAVRTDAPPTTCDVAILGGGIAGVTLAVQLWHAGLLDGTVLLERGPTLVGQFFDRLHALRQRVLRSPYEHHVGAEGHRDCELIDYARAQWRHLTPTERGEVRMAQSSQRAVVPVDVFEAYTHHVAYTHDLASRAWRASAHAVRHDGDGFVIEHDRGTLRAGAVVWAVGEAPRKLPQSWFADGRAAERASLWLDGPPPGVASAIVVGAGLSSAHLITSLCAAGARVSWVQRGSERYQCADVNARFFRPEGRAQFAAQNHDGRLVLLRRHRFPSIMLEFQPLLEGLERDGRLTVWRGQRSLRLAGGSGDGVVAELADGRRLPEHDRVVGALGLEPRLDPPLAAAADVGGWPRLDDATLQLVGCPGAYVMGSLASLAIGPAARNVDGTRVAALRITDALRSRR